MDGAQRRGDRYQLPAQSRIWVLQKAQDDVRIEGLSGSGQALQGAERSGPLALAMDLPTPVAGRLTIPASDRDRWIELVARQTVDISLYALRSEEVGARLENELRDQSLPGENVRVTRQDGQEDSFHRVTREAKLVFTVESS